MLNSHAVKAIKNRRSIIFHDTMYAKDGDKIRYEIRKEGSYYCIYPVNGSNKIGKGFLKEEDAEKKINELNLAESKDSDYRGYKVKDQIIKGFMIYKSGKPNAFTAKNESGEQYEGTMEEIKAKIDAYWVKRDEDVMKQKVNDHGYVVNRMGDYHIIEGAGVDGGWWFAKEVRGKGKLETKKFKTRAQAEEHARMSQPNLDEDVMKQKVNDAIKIVSYKGYEIIKNDNDDKFRVFLSGFEVFVPQKSLEAAKALIDKKNSKAKDSKTKDKSPRWRIKDDKMFKLRTAAKKMKDAEGNYTFLQSMAEKFIGRRLTTKEMEQAVKSNLTDYDAVKKYFEEIKKTKDTYTKGQYDSKVNDAASPALFDNDFEGWKGKAESLGYEVKENKTTGLWEAKEGIAIKGTYNKTKGGRLYLDSKAKDDVMYQGQSYPVKELHRILANKGKVKEFNELSEKEQKERMGNPFALYESGDNIYAVVRRNKVN